MLIETRTTSSTTTLGSAGHRGEKPDEIGKARPGITDTGTNLPADRSQPIFAGIKPFTVSQGLPQINRNV